MHVHAGPCDDPSHIPTVSVSKPPPALRPGVVAACPFGAKCGDASPGHAASFLHPGDYWYRKGSVVFQGNQEPEFETVWQLFHFHDAKGSGYLDRSAFTEAFHDCARLVDPSDCPSADSAWHEACKSSTHREGYVNFQQFASVAQMIGLDLPVGLEDSDTHPPCRFHVDGKPCGCTGFHAATGSTASASGCKALCNCGHGSHSHRSDYAERSCSELYRSLGGNGQSALVPVTEPAVLEGLQELLTRSHKVYDNWTRDRGCAIHGINACPAVCAAKNRTAVPTGYTLVAACRNENPELWHRYSLTKNFICKECSQPSEVPYSPVEVCSDTAFDGHLDSRCNEWRLLHGAPPERLQGICAEGFNMALAGTGHTWRAAGTDRGTPLYGFGAYFAERITKADEYASLVPEGSDCAGLYCVLVCRVIGGRVRVVNGNEIDVESLQRDVFEGSFHSVLGDRVSSLGKPYREVVLYEGSQCYPEFLLMYARSYD